MPPRSRQHLARPTRDRPTRDRQNNPSERQVNRQREEFRYASVIIKRWDQAVRHPDDVLEFSIREGIEQSERRNVSLMLSAVAAGAILAFSVMGVGVVWDAMAGSPTLTTRIAVAAAYPIGFVLCIMSSTQLFTEHTALAVYPVLDKRGGLFDLLRVWAIVLFGNLLGCVLGAGLLASAEPVVQAHAGYAAAADHFTHAPAWPMFMSAVLAGWLMALGGWLVLATMPGIAQLMVIYLVTFTIGIGGLHHAIAGSAELLTAIFTGDTLSPVKAALSIAVVTVGNLVGGATFVAILNYGHIRKTQAPEPANFN